MHNATDCSNHGIPKQQMLEPGQMGNGNASIWSWEQKLRKLFNTKQLQRNRFWKPIVCDNNHDVETLEAQKLSEKVKWKGLSYNPVATVLVLTGVWVLLYWKSLVGVDLSTVVLSLGGMAVFFFSAITCFIVAIYITVFDPTIARRTRVLLLGAILTSLHLLFLLDHGGSLKHHGAYNMLIFTTFVVPALLVAALEYGLWRVVGFRLLVAIHLPFVIFTVVRTMGALREGSAVWDQGFRGEHMLPLNVCTPVDRGLPWVDVFPQGSQNFGAGTFTCGDVAKEANHVGFSVNFSIDGELIMSCGAGKGMTYTPLPSTADWPKGDKLIEESYEGTLVRPFNKNVMDKVRETGEIAYEIQTPVLLPEGTEAVIVRCGGVEKLVTRVRPRREILQRVESGDQSQKLNVVFLFLDATSRRGFHRRLRKTVAALEDADASGVTRLYQFFRYSIVGFCTEPNSRAMFQSTIKVNKNILPPVWEDYRQSGYVTLFTADTCQDLAAAYMNRQSAHNASSFDHELLAPFCLADFFAEDGNPFGNFKGPYSITKRCLNGEQVHEHELRYLESFQSAYPDAPRFSLAWFLEGHEGTTEVLRNLDDGLAAYIRKFTDWNNTAVIIAADHGLHMGLNFGLAQNGAVEHRNPFLAMMLPPWFTDLQRRHDVMTVNQQRMVTGLDIYKTLQALRMAGLSEEERRQWVDPAAQHRLLQYSLDLLHQEVPVTRTCQDAGIPKHWCQCL